ncbi:putative undecaprenyl-phosphate N-acetylglucosaminyl 1-phosphate transferase [compost metagenome]
MLSNYLAKLLLALPTSVLMTKSLVVIANHYGWVARPKADRWHQKPTALYGGIAIVVTIIMGLLILGPGFWPEKKYDLLSLLVGGGLIFAIGLWDDIRALNPLVKLVGQVISCTVFLAGIGLAHIADHGLIFLLSLPVALLWMLGLTNSFNLLDNMDGLSAGTATIASGVLSVFLFLSGYTQTSLISALISASCLGFLFFNFRPKGSAHIFMGDCGSMFLGFMLAGLSIITSWSHASRGWYVLAIPLLIMALPIFDTTLVTILRKREGRSISQGGKDHSSHRLVYAGLNEKQAVLLLLGIAGISGGSSLLIWKFSQSSLAVLLVAAFTLGLIKFGAFLSHYSQNSQAEREATISGDGDRSINSEKIRPVEGMPFFSSSSR